MPRKLCLFGGSFDPTHLGHQVLAQRAHEACGLDALHFIPANRSPFKQKQPALFSNDERLAILKLYAQALPWASVSELDLQLPPPSWTWRLIKIYRQQEPDAELYWLMGVDQWDLLEKWARFDYLREQLTFIVHHRDHAPKEKAGVRAHFITGHHPASATQIRELLQGGKPLPEGWLLPEAEERCRQFIAAKQA